MDSLKDIDKRPWIDCEKINVHQWLKCWEKENMLIEFDLDQNKLEEKITGLLNAPKDIIDSIEEDSSLDNLTTVQDKEWKDYLFGNNFDCPSYVTLKSVAAQVNHVEECERNGKYRAATSNLLRYHSTNFLPTQTKESEKMDNESKIEGLEAILHVQMLRPMHSSHYVGEHRKHAIPIVEKEFLCLSQQRLTELKDEIICPLEASSVGDVSEDPDTPRTTAKEIYTSGFFFINDCFYSDMRKTTNIDYSQAIRDWAAKSDRGIGLLRCSKMEDTFFSDLSIRLGQPYVYVHQGDCEHMVIFTELRLFSPQTDCHFINEYPKVCKTVNRSAKKCFMCHLNIAKWVVFENKRLPEEPFFFCDQCLKTFNYDSAKKKIGKFKVYSYLDRSAFL